MHQVWDSAQIPSPVKKKAKNLLSFFYVMLSSLTTAWGCYRLFYIWVSPWQWVFYLTTWRILAISKWSFLIFTLSINYSQSTKHFISKIFLWVPPSAVEGRKFVHALSYKSLDILNLKNTSTSLVFSAAGYCFYFVTHVLPYISLVKWTIYF